MKKGLYFSIVILLSLFCVNDTVDCSAKTSKYTINNYKKIIVKKGDKIKLVNNGTKKMKWTISDKNIASISKKGILRAKKCGKVRVTAKTNKGNKFVCKIIVKKKIVKASGKTVKAKFIKIEDKKVCFTIYNNSDECLMFVNPCLQYSENNEWKFELKKEVLVDMRPHIIILPRSRYNFEYSFDNHKMTHNIYRVIFEGVFKGPAHSKVKMDDDIYMPFRLTN